VLQSLAEQGVKLLAVRPRDGAAAALIAAQYGRFETLSFIVEHAGPGALRMANSFGYTCAHYSTYAAQNRQLPMLQWIVSQLGHNCLSSADNHGQTAVFSGCYEGHLAVVEYIFDVLGGAALRVADTDSDAPLRMLERYEGTEFAQLRMVVPHEQPARLCAMKRLELAKAVHARLGANSPLAELSERELQKLG